jgi:hypothetical protein
MVNERLKDLPTGLYWQGEMTKVERILLPLQTIGRKRYRFMFPLMSLL